MSKKGKTKADKTAQEGDGLTGVFANDFPLHCVKNGLPPVAVASLPRPEAPAAEDVPPPGSSSTSPPCRHSVLVETDPADAHCIKKMQLRNFLLDKRVLVALSAALDSSQLETLSLWNVGLTADTQLEIVIQLVTSCSIKRLALDGNSVSANQISSLLQLPSLEQLSLKCCCLGDAFCENIRSALAANHTLLALDLSSNQITNEGVGHLASALRINRTLLSLGLAGNRIGDEGVDAICQVLLKFRLTREEEKSRTALMASSDGGGGMDIIGRSPSVISLDKSGRTSRGGGSKGKKEQKDKGGKSSSQGSKGGKGSKMAGKKGSGVKGDEAEDPPQGAAGGGGAGEPLVELVSEEDGKLWMQGNASLTHLTLACNRVGVRGVASLLSVVRTQRDSTLSPVTSDPATSEKVGLAGTGLIRVTLQHNKIPAEYAELAEMISLLQSRDPLAPPTKSEDTPTSP